jgi:hypothetical protein
MAALRRYVVARTRVMVVIGSQGVHYPVEKMVHSRSTWPWFVESDPRLAERDLLTTHGWEPSERMVDHRTVQRRAVAGPDLQVVDSTTLRMRSTMEPNFAQVKVMESFRTRHDKRTETPCFERIDSDQVIFTQPPMFCFPHSSNFRFRFEARK